MIYGLYLSAQGAETQSKRLDVIANNLANANTSSFKRDLAVFQAQRPFDVKHQITNDVPGELNQSTGGVLLADVVTDFSNGPIINTGGMYDIALAGPGFLRVSNGQQEFLTRNGQLTVNSQGELVPLNSGYRVMGTVGSITIPSGVDVEIAANGEINTLDSEGVRSPVGKLDLVQPENTESLEKVGNSLYRAQGELIPAGEDTQVKQGFVEGSGTRSVVEMVQLIEASRAFETNVNMIKFRPRSESTSPGPSHLRWVLTSDG